MLSPLVVIGGAVGVFFCVMPLVFMCQSGVLPIFFCMRQVRLTSAPVPPPPPRRPPPLDPLQSSNFPIGVQMSSYLLAFCIGEFDYVQGSTKEGRVGVRVYTPPGKSHLGTFALEVAEKTLDLYDSFFQVCSCCVYLIAESFLYHRYEEEG